MWREVIYTSNARIYGKEYGSGKCYLCTECGAYVGTHKPRPRQALGVLANERMRKARTICHEIFDTFWRGKRHARNKRNKMYQWLAKELDIDVKDCHFGYFDIEMLKRAYTALKKLKGEENI